MTMDRSAHSRLAVTYRRISSLNQVDNNSMCAQEQAIKDYAKKNHVITTDGLNSMDEDCMSEILDEATSAEKYSRRLSKETMKGLRVNAEQMLHNGGLPPYGYTVGSDKKLYIDEAKAPAVRKMFEMYAAGMSYKQIAQWLDDNGFTTVKGGNFKSTSIKTILENEKYCGTYFWNKRASKDFRGMRNSHQQKEDYYQVHGAIEPIVSEELFDKVQERLHDNKNRIRNYNGKNYYPLNGKVFCGKCGKKLSGHVQYSRTSKNNVPVKQYRFSCPAVKTVNEKYLDDMVINGLRACIFSPENYEELVDKLNAYGKIQERVIDLQIEVLRSDKENAEKRCSNLMDIAENGDGTKSIIDKIKRLDKRIAKIDRRISDYEAAKKVFTAEDIDRIRDRFTEYVMENRNENVLGFLEDTVDRIEVDDTVRVHLKKNICVDRETKKGFRQERSIKK